MKFLFVVSIFAILLCSVNAEAVVSLTESTFDSFVNGEEYTIVEFFAPWCGHCKRLEPEYERAATELGRSDLRLGKVDATEEKALANRFNVRGYPTLKVFRNGVASDYDGPRDSAGIIKYVRKNAGPAAVEIGSDSEAAVRLAEKSRESVIVGRFEEDGSGAHRAFVKVAEALRDEFSFAVAVGVDAAEEGVAMHRAKRFVSKKYDQAVIAFDGGDASKVSDVRAWAGKNELPLVSERTRDNQPKFERSGKTVVTLYAKIDYELDPKGSNYFANRLRRSAVDYADKFVFAVANKLDFTFELEELGLSKKDIAVAAKAPGGKKYRMEGDWSVDATKEFLKKLADGEVPQYIKSEPTPESNDGPVTVVTGNTFDDIVDTSGGKSILLEFYAPWCGHCKSLAPKYEDLGKRFADDDSVVIAKIDATANDFPSRFNVRGYPSLFWLQGSNAPVKYDGAREADDMEKWIKERIAKEDL